MTNSHIDRNGTSRHRHDADEDGTTDAHNHNGTLDDRLWQSDALLGECESYAAWTPRLLESNNANADAMIDEMIAEDQRKVRELVARFQGRGGRPSRSSGPRGGRPSSSADLCRSDSALLDEREGDAARTPCLPPPSWESDGADAVEAIDETIADDPRKVQELVARLQGGSSESRGGRPPPPVRRPRSRSSSPCRFPADSDIPKTHLRRKSSTSMTSASSGSSKSSNAAAEANSDIRYKIGQALLDSSHSIPFGSSSEASALLAKLPLNSPLFVRRTNGEWTLALLAGRKTNRHGRKSLVVDFRKGGGWKKKGLRGDLWEGSLRLLNREVVSWDPPSAGPNAGGRPAASASGPAKTEPEAARARAPGARPPREVSTEKADERLVAMRTLARTTKALQRENRTVREERDLLRTRLEESERARVHVEARMEAERARGVLSAVHGRLRANARAKETEVLSSETTKSVEELKSEKQCLKDCLDIIMKRMRNLQADLDTALESKRTAEAARDRAKAREAQMKGEVENLQEYVKCNELSVRTLLDEKDDAIGRLEAELRIAKEGVVSFEERARRIADRDYFDEDAPLGPSRRASDRSFSLAGGLDPSRSASDRSFSLAGGRGAPSSASDRSFSLVSGHSGRWWPGARGRGADDDDETCSYGSGATWTTAGRRSVT